MPKRLKTPKGYHVPKGKIDLRALAAAGQLFEQCSCGHWKKDHLGLQGHGPCAKCPCVRFRWERWLAKDVP